MQYKYIMVNTTCANKEEAVKIANLLLSHKLAACIELDEIESHYLRKNKVEVDKEILLKIKTRLSLYDKVEKLIKDNHSYELPQIIAIPIVKGSADYLKWVDEITSNKDRMVI